MDFIIEFFRMLILRKYKIIVCRKKKFLTQISIMAPNVYVFVAMFEIYEFWWKW